MTAAVQAVLEQAMQLTPRSAPKWRGGGSGGGGCGEEVQAGFRDGGLGEGWSRVFTHAFDQTRVDLSIRNRPLVTSPTRGAAPHVGHPARA